jgi:hypothetical protein
VPGSTGQLRVRAYLDALLGQDTAAHYQAAQAAPATEPGASPAGHTQPSESPQDGPAQHGPAQHGPAQHGPAQHGPARHGPAVGQGNSQAGRVADAGHPMARINLTIPLATLLGLAEHPGEAAGFGPIDPDLARDLAAQAAGNPGTAWCITVTDPVGHPVAHGCARRGKPKRKPPRRTQPPDAGERPPGSSTRRTGHRSGPRAGQSLLGTAGPPSGSGTWRLHLPTPTGTGPPGPPDSPGLAVDLEPIPVSDCDHRHQTTAHDPSDHLRHLVEVRDGECDYPPCRRAAARCDFEHTTPWEDGGLTCSCNAGPRCRHHHHTKQAPGWRVEQHQPGYRAWTTPAGRTYTTGPTTYPV